MQMKIKNHIRMTTAERVYQIIIAIGVGAVALMCIFPLLYVIGMSLTSEGEMIERNYFVIIPMHPILRAYQVIFSQQNIGYSIFVSVARTVLGAAAALVLTVPGGYILSIKKLPGRSAAMIYFIITMLLGGGIIPSYLLMKYLNLINKFWVYIIPAMGGTFNMLIVKIFVENMPDNIMESADLDGASEIQKMRHIAIPLLVPTICAIALFAAVGQWNSWFDVMLYTSNPKIASLSFTVRQLLISNLMPNDLSVAQLLPRQRMTTVGMQMASVVVAVIPILCVYPFLQKYFIYGVYTGSVKG